MENYRKKESNRAYTYNIQFDMDLTNLYGTIFTPASLISNNNRITNGYSLAMSNVSLDRVKFSVNSLICHDPTANGGIFNTNPYYFLIVRNTTGYVSNRIEYTGSGSDDTRLCTIIAQDIPSPMTLAGVLGCGTGYTEQTFDIANLTGNFTIRVTDNGFTTQASTDIISFNLQYTEYITIN